MNESDQSPSISKTAFACPHCGAYTTQYWSRVFHASYREDPRTPGFPDADVREEIKADSTIEKEQKRNLLSYIDNILKGKPFSEASESSPYNPPIVHNLNLSRCYNCNEFAIWVHERMVYPSSKVQIKPNPDLPEVVEQLFEEAQEIVAASPKGAAALLRLSIQHLCVELGESGKNIDKDIAALVAKGLNPMVQQALDVVRVIGNESVHPGTIDLNDDRDVAIKLFGLVNLIADQMITHPKQVQELYNGLPPEKLEGIRNRDGNKKE